MTLSLLQSKTPALVFEYINNTDFKVSLPACGKGRLPISLECCDLGLLVTPWKLWGEFGVFTYVSFTFLSPCKSETCKQAVDEKE